MHINYELVVPSNLSKESNLKTWVRAGGKGQDRQVGVGWEGWGWLVWLRLNDSNHVQDL